MLAFSFDNLSLSPADVHYFFCKILREINKKMNKKRPGLPFLKGEAKENNHKSAIKRTAQKILNDQFNCLIILFTASVTRWLYYFSLFGYLQQLKFAQYS